MTRDSVDILISGGGIAGLAAAAAFGSAGFRVICVDPAPPVRCREADGADLRTTAFLQPSRACSAAHAASGRRWNLMRRRSQIMRIIDAVGWPPEIRATRTSDADDISDQPFRLEPSELAVPPRAGRHDRDACRTSTLRMAPASHGS